MKVKEKEKEKREKIKKTDEKATVLSYSTFMLLFSLRNQGGVRARPAPLRTKGKKVENTR